MIPPTFLISNVPHLIQPNDYSCSETAALMIHQYHGVRQADGRNENLDNFVRQCSAKIGVRNSDEEIQFENMLPCMSPQLDCNVAHLDSIDDLKQLLHKTQLPLILRYRAQYNHSIVVRGYTPDRLIVNDPALTLPGSSVSTTKIDRWWAQADGGRPIMLCQKKK